MGTKARKKRQLEKKDGTTLFLLQIAIYLSYHLKKC